MDDKNEKYVDLTEEASDRGEDGATSRARQAESDDMYQGAGMMNTPSPEGDRAGENKVATSIDDE